MILWGKAGHQGWEWLQKKIKKNKKKSLRFFENVLYYNLNIVHILGGNDVHKI